MVTVKFSVYLVSLYYDLDLLSLCVLVVRPSSNNCIIICLKCNETR